MTPGDAGPEKCIFRQVFWVHSTQMLVKICNNSSFGPMHFTEHNMMLNVSQLYSKKYFGSWSCNFPCTRTKGWAALDIKNYPSYGASCSNGYGICFITHSAEGPGIESPWRMWICVKEKKFQVFGYGHFTFNVQNLLKWAHQYCFS